MFYGTNNIQRNIPPYPDWMWRIFRGILSVMQNIVMDMNNIMMIVLTRTYKKSCKNHKKV